MDRTSYVEGLESISRIKKAHSINTQNKIDSHINYITHTKKKINDTKTKYYTLLSQNYLYTHNYNEGLGAQKSETIGFVTISLQDKIGGAILPQLTKTRVGTV